ncbi:hypothetical protein IBTHAUMO2_840002 [Nitrosopumilaceae archaeon]|nr:hypothetical protein [Nitrosopumilus sp.]MDA7997919.1 hypothetical protein [Nitrosopumilus sp.]CAI9832561.1 hypothetical protein IBTHAUMO2_840002 [Nitrosopumilaceae archaeon]
MRILAPTYVHPSRHHIRTAAFGNVFGELKKRADLEVTWAFFQPDRMSGPGADGARMLDIHDFADAVSLLESAAPDGILVTGTADIIQHSFCIAARHLGIPVFSIYVYGVEGGVVDTPARQAASGVLNTLFSDRMATDTAGQSRPFRRAGFVMYKSRFMLRTMLRAGAGMPSSAAAVSRHILMDVLGRFSRYNELADCHFLPDDSWIPVLVGLGISRDDIFVTGNPYWEDFGELGAPKPAKAPGDPADLLIVTDSLMGHNYWTKGQSDEFILRLVSGLSGDPSLRISVKIHPSSEDMQYYEGLLEGRGIRILQQEKIPDIIRDFDIAVSFGDTTAQTQVLASGTRMVNVETGLDLSTPSLYAEGAASGLAVRCGLDGVAGAVRDLLGSSVKISGELDARRREMFPEAGASSSRIASVVAERLGR